MWHIFLYYYCSFLELSIYRLLVIKHLIFVDTLLIAIQSCLMTDIWDLALVFIIQSDTITQYTIRQHACMSPWYNQLQVCN